MINKDLEATFMNNSLYQENRTGHLIVQIYVDDIIFGATNESLYKEFSEMMQNEFKMSMNAKIQYFLGLQINHTKEGTFINQAKYCKELLKMFDMEKTKLISTIMSTSCKIDKDEKGKLFKVNTEV